MPSKYAIIIKEGYTPLEIRNWDGIYYWSYEDIHYGKQWRKIPKESAPFVEENIKKYNGVWYTTLSECEKLLQGIYKNKKEK